MPATFEIIARDTGRVLMTQADVLDPVRLAGCSITSGSSVLTVPTTANLHPGMGVECSGIPRGSLIASIIDATKVKLVASGVVNNKWETNEAMAEATATVSDRTAIFTGHPLLPVAALYSRGPYRDEFESSRSNPMWTSRPPLVGLGIENYIGAQTTENGYVPEGAGFDLGAARSRLSDPVAHVPHRHLTESWSEWLFVCTGGHVAHVLANPDLHAVRMKTYTPPA